MTNTNAGENLWGSVRERFEVSRCDVSTAIAHNAGIVQGKDVPPVRQVVYRELAERGFSYVARRYYRLSLLRRVYSRIPILARIWGMLK